MTKKTTTKKGQGSRKGVTAKARAIVADVEAYDEDTRLAIQKAIDENDPNLAELVRRAEAGDTILDVSDPATSEAIAYARRAYDAALAHYEAASHKPHPPFFFEPWESGRQEFEDYRRSAAFFAHILASKGCPKEFRQLFDAVFGQMIEVAAKHLDHPYLLPLTYPIVRDICDASNYCGTADGLHDALIKAVEVLVPDELADEAREAMK